MNLKLSSIDDAKSISEFYLENGDHLRPWEPEREIGYHSCESWKVRLAERVEEQEKGKAAYFLSYALNSSELLATCSLTSIAHGPFQACFMGYSVAVAYEGKGVMKELCSYVINYAFSEIGLNRIMANYIPSNIRSGRLLENLGFSKEGVAKKYLCINGQWEDHVLTSLLNPKNT